MAEGFQHSDKNLINAPGTLNPEKRVLKIQIYILHIKKKLMKY
jgi:hypothetical protein